MALNKFDKTSDAIADLYRAALYLGRKSEETGISFFLKAKEKLGNKILIDSQAITKSNTFKNPLNFSYWAEKILDEYKRLKMSLSSN